MRKLLIAIIGIVLGEMPTSKAQVNAGFNTTAVGVNASSDRFSHDGRQIANYGLGWYNDSWFTGGPTAYMASFGGLKFFAQGALSMTIKAGGNIGVGVANPVSRLQVPDGSTITVGSHTNANVSSSIHFAGFRDNQSGFFGASIEGSPSWLCCNGFPNSGYAGVKLINLDFYVHNNWEIANSKKLAMRIAGNGNLGIGTTTPQAKLAVNGNILAREVKVKTDIAVPDYVFEEGYKLPDLRELEAYVRLNKHLPEVPSAAEIDRDGLDLASMNLLLLKKVEELTPLLIELKKEVSQSKLAKE